MSNPSDSSAKCPVASSSKAQTKGIGKSQEQRGPYNTDRDSKPTESPSDTRKGRAPTRRSGSGQTEKQTEGQESHATSTSDRKGAPERQANGNPQRKKQKDCERGEPLKTLESKTEDQRTTEEKKRKASKPVTSKSDSVGAAHAQGSDAPKSAKSGTQSKPMVERRDQSASIASDINPPSRQTNGNPQRKKQKDCERDEPLKGLESKTEDQRTTEEKKRKASKPVTSKSDSVGAAHAQGSDAPKSAKSGTQSKPMVERRDQSASIASDINPPSRQTNGNPQRKKQKDCERDEPLKGLENKTEDQRTTEEKKRKASKPVTSKSDSVRAAHAQGSDAPKSAKSGTQSKPMVERRDQSASIASDITPNSFTQNDLSDTDSVREDAPPELPSTSQERRKPNLTKPHNSKNTESTEEDTGAHQSPNIELEKVLLATIGKLKIKKLERSKASSCVNEVTDKVISHLKQNVTWCKDIEGLTTGSYYENVKICKPDEFDVMLTIPLERVDIQEFSDNGAFYSIALKRHSDKHPLHKFLNEDKTIKASEMLNEFRDGVKEALESMKHKKYSIDVQRKKQKCPAVTLEVTENGNAISIDFVLGLKVCSRWPSNTNDGFKIEKWLGTKEKSNLKRKPYYLVPKYEGKGNVEHGGVVAKDVWRISFSHIEKAILKKHGHSKTCCEAHGKKCCRKECLKLLKYLLSQLEEEHPDKMSKFCSYHAKTALLHACATKVEDSEWAYGLLANCFLQLLDAFVAYLSKQDLRNFFVPSQNLLHPDYLPKSNCEFLVKQIEIQRNNNFPIFQ